MNMKNTQRPFRTTIFIGFIFGISFIPLNLLFGYMIPWSTTFKIIIWTYLAGYALFLTRWGRKSPLLILFPVLLLLVFVFIVNANSAFILLALIIFSWIRSGVCFQKSLSRMLYAELFLTLGGAALVAWFTPHSTFAWALGILMFFLVQSLYFIAFEDKDVEDQVEVDPFEAALWKAEKIITN